MNEKNQSFKDAIKSYLDRRAGQDELFAKTYAKEGKTLEECCNYIIGASSKADKTLADSIGIFANTFAAEVRTYKLSELMLFFARYKAGVYDNSYATFDTRRIGNAFFKEFLPQRAAELAAIERDRATEAYLKSRELPEGYTVPEGYNPYTWYQERVRLGEIKSYGNLSKL